MGLFKGNQTQLGYLYPKTTDFIFAVISEEMGFVVAGAIIVLYVILITKSIQVAKTAKDDLGSYIATGIVGIFFLSYVRKYRNDNGTIAYYRNTTSICKLWWKLNAHKPNSNSNFIKHKHQTQKSNVYRIKTDCFFYIAQTSNNSGIAD